MTLAELSEVLVYGAIAVHGLAFLAYTAWTVLRVLASRSPVLVPTGGASPPVKAGTLDASRRETRCAAVAHGLTTVAVGLNLGAVVLRGVVAGRAPWGNMYEFALVAALAAGTAFVVLARRHPLTGLGSWLTALLLADLGLAVTVLATPIDALVPVLDSWWLVVHVAAAIVAGGLFSVGFVATLLSLLPRGSDGKRSRLGATLPERAVLGRIAHAAHVAAFPLWTFAVIAGAIWAENAWGRYWGWDPKETWAFITWVFYAAYLHADATPGWRGRKASWFAMAGYAAFIFNFFGVNMWLPGLHSYAGV